MLAWRKVSLKYRLMLLTLLIWGWHASTVPFIYFQF